MKSVINILLILILVIACNGKDIIVEIKDDSPVTDKERYITSYLFNYSDFKTSPFSISAQGMDVYIDKYLFQAGLLGSTISIIDIDSLRLEGTIEFEAPCGESSHMNNINCGPKYDITDKWPLLYLSQTVDSHSCFVLRLSNDASSYTLLQTIQYKGSLHFVNSLYDWFIDTKNGYIYAYGYMNGIKEERDIVKFLIPSVNRSTITFTDDDIIDSFKLNNMSIYQGSKIVDNLLYAPVGLGDHVHPGFISIINLEEKRLVASIPINCGEPESVGQYKDGLIICGGGMSPNYYFFQL